MPSDAFRAGATEARSSPRATWCALALLSVLLFQGLLFITASSQTSDEAAHLLAGYTYLTTGDFRVNREEPPLIKELAALPLLFLGLERPTLDPERGMGVFRMGPAFVHGNRAPADTILLLGRLPVLTLSLLLGWTIFHWGRMLFGPRCALLPLALYVLDPNVVAHSCLITTDVGVTLFILLTLHLLWRWAARPSPALLVAAGCALGAAFASKPTAAWILPILGVLGVLHYRAGGSLRPGALLRAGTTLLALAALIVVLACGVRGVPDYVAGVWRGIGHTTSGQTGYLLGEWSAEGWWYYFLFAFLVKTPIGSLLLVGTAALLLLLGKLRPAGEAVVLWVPIVVIVAITCVWRVNIGLRHLLPLYPFLFLTTGGVAAAAFAPDGGQPRWRRRLLSGFTLACLGWTGIEAARITPYQLAYFNQLVGGPRNGHRYLLDSNLDWGQAMKTLRDWMAAENVPVLYCSFAGGADPAYYGVRYQYVPGFGNFADAASRGVVLPAGATRELLAVSATALHFVRSGRETLYDWLGDRPVAAAPGHAFLVYDITGDADIHARLAQLYLEWQLPMLAASEAWRALRIDPELDRARAVLERLKSG